MAGSVAARPQVYCARRVLAAAVGGDRATGVKTASCWRVRRRREITLQLDGRRAFARILDLRDGGQQRLGIGMGGGVQHFGGLAFLDDAAKIHHRDAVTDIADYRDIVRDEQIGQAEFALQLFEQFDDLRLDRDVQRRDRLVADHEFGLHDQRTRDPDPLALPARELVRIAVQVTRVQPDALQDLHRAIPDLAAPRQPVQTQGLGHDLAHRASRVE